MAIKPCNPEAYPPPCDEAIEHAHRALSLVLLHMLSTQLCLLYIPGTDFFLDIAAVVTVAFCLPELMKMGQAAWAKTG